MLHVFPIGVFFVAIFSDGILLYYGSANYLQSPLYFTPIYPSYYIRPRGCVTFFDISTAVSAIYQDKLCMSQLPLLRTCCLELCT